MAKRTKTLVGLDIDATGIVAASVVVNGRVRVERAAFAPLEPGIIRDGEVADVDGLAEALRTLYRENKGLDKRVRVGLANQKIVVRVIDLPYLEDAKELAAAVRFQAQDQLPMPLEHAVLDHQPLAVVNDADGPAPARAARRGAPRDGRARPRRAARRRAQARGRRPLRLRHGPRAAPRRPRRRARPLPRHRRPHQPRGRPRHRVHLRPRLRQRRRGPRRRARRARRADARARLRLAGPRRRAGARRGRSPAIARSSSTPARSCSTASAGSPPRCAARWTSTACRRTPARCPAR